jgi:UDP-N-acetylmuramoyl-tripeptide--D-alanyl-D-alanine ligase
MHEASKVALGVICAHEKKHLISNVCAHVLCVKDTALFYKRIAQHWRERFPIKIAILTGSVGKTTVKAMVGRVLENIGPTLPYEGNFNNEFGVTQTLLKINSDQPYGVIEIGARHVGDIESLTPYCVPQVAACLNVGNAHVGEFGSIANIYKTKLEIFDASPKNTCLVGCGDDEIIRNKILSDSRSSVLFGFDNKNDVCICNVRWDGLIQIIAFSIQGRMCEVTFPMGHEAYPINAAAALAICISLGISLETITNALSGFTGLLGRFNIFHVKKASVIDDAYNANPASMRSGLDTFQRYFSNHKKIVILGDMLELGDSSEREHVALGKHCAVSVNPDMLIAVGTCSQWMASEAKKHGLECVMHYPTVEDLLSNSFFETFLCDILCDSPIAVYIKSSHGIGLHKLVSAIKCFALNNGG